MIPNKNKPATLTQEEFDKLKESYRVPYLTEQQFFDWVQNHFTHLDKKVAYIAGTLVILVPLIIAIFIKIFWG